MSPLSTVLARPALPEDLQALRGSWGWFLTLGIALAALGTFAIGWACIAEVTIAATWLFGFLMLAGGIAEVIGSFTAARWSGTLVHLLIGVLYAVVGIMIIDRPVQSALELTLLIAIFLMIGGIYRTVSALSHRFSGWEWVLLNGVVTFLLGLLIYKQLPASGLWFIGLYIGIDMILNGWAWIALALALRRLPERA